MFLCEFLLFLALQQTGSGLEVTVPQSPQAASIGSNVHLPCTFRAKDYPVNPVFLAVVWKFGDKELYRYDNKGIRSNSKASIDTQAALKGDVSLSLPNVTLSDEGTYKCIVIYSPEMGQKTINLRLQATPFVKMTKKALLKNQKNRLVCSATDFYPRAITMTWLWNGQVLLTSDMEKPQENSDGTYSVNSSVILNPTKTQEDQLIECQVEHESLGKPITDGYTVIYGEPPTVQIYSTEIPGRREKVVICEATEFYPEAITVNWKLKGKLAENLGRKTGGTFTKRIYSHVHPSPDNEPEDFSCEVQHETLLIPITQTHQVRYFGDQDKFYHLGVAAALGMLLTLSGIGVLLGIFVFKKKYFQRFIVSPIYGPETSNDNDKVTFYCVAFNCPIATRVMWCVKESGEDTFKSSEPWSKDEEERLLGCGYTIRTDQFEDKGLHKVITALNFTPSVSIHINTTIVCRFTSDGKTKAEKIKWKFPLSKPQVSGEKPIALSLGDSGDVICSTNLKDFNPKDIVITWSCGAGHYQDLETINVKITKNSQQTYDAKSVCRIPGNRFNDPGFKVRVTWRHLSMEEAERKEASAADLPWRPQMSDISVPRLLLHGEEAKLQCTISGYFPGDLKVNWLRREAGKPDLFPVSPSDKYKLPVMDVTRQEDQTFTCTASLIYSVSRKTDHGSEFICQVGHPSLESPLEKRTGELDVEGILAVDVMLDDTQSDRWLIAEVKSFYPRDIKVTWSRTTLSMKGYEEYPESDITFEGQLNNDGTFRLISKCKISKFNKPNKTYKVSVSHKSLESPIEKIILRSKVDMFILEEDKTPLPRLSSQGEKTLPPDSQKLKGSAGKRDDSRKPEEEKEEEESQVDRRFSLGFSSPSTAFGGSSAAFGGLSAAFGGLISSIRRIPSVHLGPCAKPKVSDKKPIALSLGDSGDVICSTELKDFNPKDIVITWSCGAGHYQDLETINEEITENSQKMYDAKSECRIPGHRFNEPGFKVRVTWRHNSMEEPERREASAAGNGTLCVC
uniref:Ig-like domain-containing protein n=1 Tax=Leptobrachium leishanense TaxID=445787 RepID=A0A8C5PNR9_9ANUR